MAELQIALENTNAIAINMNGSEQIDIDIGSGSGQAPIRNYELLNNKPQINGVTLIGNKYLCDLFQDGIIIDGGSAEGVMF